MGDNDLDNLSVTEQPVLTGLPDPRQVPLDLDLELVKSVYNTFCDRVEDAGLPRPPYWN